MTARATGVGAAVSRSLVGTSGGCAMKRGLVPRSGPPFGCRNGPVAQDHPLHAGLVHIPEDRGDVECEPTGTGVGAVVPSASVPAWHGARARSGDGGAVIPTALDLVVLNA